jgi:hypothetical protein
MKAKIHKTPGKLSTCVKPISKEKTINFYSSNKGGVGALNILYLAILAVICLSAIIFIFKILVAGVGAFLILWFAWALLVSRVNR